MSKKLLWFALLLALCWPLLFLIGCRDRDGLVDAGPVIVDPAVLPPGLRPDPRPEVRP